MSSIDDDACPGSSPKDVGGTQPSTEPAQPERPSQMNLWGFLSQTLSQGNEFARLIVLVGFLTIAASASGEQSVELIRWIASRF